MKPLLQSFYSKTRTGLMLLLVIILACQKTDLESVDPALRQSGNTSPMTSRTSIAMPVVQSGILKFQDQDHLWDYLDYLKEEEENYEIPSGEEDAENPYLDYMETILGYSSLRTSYNQKEELDENYIENLDFYIGNPYYQTVFNEYHELWVGNDIYKYVGNDLLATAPNNDLTTILDMRARNGVFRPGVTVFNEAKQEVVTQPVAPPCFFTLEEFKDPVAPNDLVKIRIRGIDANGNNIPFCSGTLTINWGDGIVEGPTPGSIGIHTHQYSVPIDNCITPNITVTFTPTSCGTCSFTMVQDIIISRCGPNTRRCIEGKNNGRKVWEEYFTDNGDNFRLIGIAGYDTFQRTFRRPHIWTRLTSYKQKNNGRWKKKSLSTGHATFLHGFVRHEVCDGQDMPFDRGGFHARRASAGIKEPFDDIDGNGVNRIVGIIIPPLANSFTSYIAAHNGQEFISGDLPVFE